MTFGKLSLSKKIALSELFIMIKQLPLLKKINEKIKEYKRDNPKEKKSRKLINGVSYKLINNRIKEDLKEIANNYEIIINYIQKIKPIYFIENFLNKNLINDKKYLINTQFS